MDTSYFESHGNGGVSEKETSASNEGSIKTNGINPSDVLAPVAPLSAVEAATALSVCAALHLQVVQVQARFVADEVQKLQYEAATPEAIIASPSVDVTLLGPGGRAATDVEATVLSLLDASGTLSSPSCLQEAMILMTKLKNVRRL
jgi:hypothetical protein